MTQQFSSSQLRAARGLLNWSRSDLAARTGVSEPTLHRFENNQGAPGTNTQNKIRSALQQMGIKFTERGVEWNENPIRIIEGEDSYLRSLEDAHEILKGKKSEMLIWNADHSVSPQSVIDIQLAMRKDGIKFRYLIEEGNTYIHFPLEECRLIPKEFFKNNVQQIYGQRIALSIYPSVATKISNGVIIIENAPLADSMRNAFNFMWKYCKKPASSSASKIYR